MGGNVFSLVWAMSTASKVLLMIIHDFDVVRIPIPPSKTNPKLVVDPDTVLAPPISFKRFQSEAGETEIFERGCCVQKSQPDARRLFNRLKSSARFNENCATPPPRQRAALPPVLPSPKSRRPDSAARHRSTKTARRPPPTYSAHTWQAR